MSEKGTKIKVIKSQDKTQEKAKDIIKIPKSKNKKK